MDQQQHRVIIDELVEYILSRIEDTISFYDGKAQGDKIERLSDVFELQQQQIVYSRNDGDGKYQISLIQPQVYKQYNMLQCGYHSTINLIQSAYLIKNKQWNCNIQYYGGLIYNVHLTNTIKFLLEDRVQNNLEKIKFWDQEKIMQIILMLYSIWLGLVIVWDGLLDTVIWKERNRVFRNAFKSNNEVEVDQFTLFINFGNIHNERADILGISKKLDRFRTQDKEGIVLVQLGIVFHWVCLIMHRKKEKVELVYCDSHNNQILELDEQGIKQFVQQKNVERQEKMKKPSYTSWEVNTFEQYIRDTQILMELLIDIIQGRQTLLNYQLNKSISLLLIQFEQLIGANQDIQIQQIIINDNGRPYYSQFNDVLYFVEHCEQKQIDKHNQELLNKYRQLIAVIKPHDDQKILKKIVAYFQTMFDYIG